MANFQFVSKFGGQYIPLQQAGLKEIYEAITKQPFDGACAGAVAYMLEKLIEPPFPYTSRFYQAASAGSKPAISGKELIVHYQIAYERDSEHFFTRFIRGLRISPTGYADDEYFCQNNDQFIQLLARSDASKNQVSLINLQYEFKTVGKVVQQHHMITLIKQNGRYICYDPNLGVATFTQLDSLQQWLAAEMEAGALQHFTQDVRQKMRVSDKQGSVQSGLLRVKSVFVQDFLYPAKLGLNAVLPLVPQEGKGKARL